MDSAKKVAIGVTAAVLLAAGIRVGLIYRERNTPASEPSDATRKTDADNLVFLKKERPSSLADAKQLGGRTVWVAAGGQLDYYPYAAHKADYARSAGTLLGAEPMAIKDAFEQVPPQSARSRIPSGDKQVLLAFTLPKSSDPKREYAVPVGYSQAGEYTFETDDILFYDDPHELYKYWGPQVWKTIDAHQVIQGMTERQVELSLGQVSRSLSTDYGNRLVVFANLGKPMAVTFVGDHVTLSRPIPSY